MIGKVLNERYRIDSKIGSGGMADVYCAYDSAEDRVVAVKVLKQEYCDDPQYLRRFTREAQAMLALSHENIVSLYDVGNDDDLHYIVIEYVNGCTLRDYIKRNGALKPHVAVRIICAVLEGLKHAHENGLIHRDVKPQNVMISTDKKVKLMDFGIAKFADNSTRTYDGAEALGSVYYLSPEQAKGEDVDAQADIYSTGIMLYEMLVGEPPFTGDTPVQIALKHINDALISPNAVNPHIPVAISDVVVRATAKDKALRYQTAEEMIRDLMRALRHPRARINVSTRATASVDSTVEPQRGSKVDRLVSMLIIVSVLAVVAIFAAMFVVWLDGRTDDRQYVSVPNLLGMSVQEARSYAENRNFYYEVVGEMPSDNYASGVVCKQSPEGHLRAAQGTTIQVWVSSGGSATTVVPDLYGRSLNEINYLLEMAGLTLDMNIRYEVDSEELVGLCISQYPAAEQTAVLGDTVNVTICVEAISDTRIMPYLNECDSVNEAVSLLRTLGINKYMIHVSDYAETGEEYREGQIVSQFPAGGVDIIYSAITVHIYIYKASPGDYVADFSQILELTAESNDILVTLETGYIGEVVIFETELGAGSHTVPFTARFWTEGNYKCHVYVNGVEYTQFWKEFTLPINALGGGSNG